MKRDDAPPPEASHYLHVLDEFRWEYEEKSGEKFSVPVQGMATLNMPTWEYVCWLERKLAGAIPPKPLPTTLSVTTNPPGVKKK